MEYLSLVITIIAGVITILSYLSGRKIKKLIVNEKEMMADGVSGVKTALKRQVEKVINDRKKLNNETLDTAGIRVEDLEGMIRNLDRVERRLREIK